MPNDSLTEAIKEAYSSAPIDVVILHTIELRHDLFVDEEGSPTQIRVILDNRDWTARLESSAPVDGGNFVNFTGFAFNLSLPPIDDGAQPVLKLVIDKLICVDTR